MKAFVMHQIGSVGVIEKPIPPLNSEGGRSWAVILGIDRYDAAVIR
jgi:hypothetical protein